MRNFYLLRVILYSVLWRISFQQNVTKKERGHRDQNLMNVLQQMQIQLNSIETESVRQSSRIQDVLRAATRLESQRQEFIGILDRSDSHLSQRLEDVKGDIRKISTLQDVIREDLDKIQQNQLLAKVWLQEQLQNAIHRSATKLDSSAPESTSLAGSTDVLTSLQFVQSALQGLRRMADTLQSNIDSVKANLTSLTNLTRSISTYEKESLVSKSYLQSSLLAVTSEKVDQIYNPTCFLPTTKKEGEEALPRDCSEVQKRGLNESGVYHIHLEFSQRPILVFCDMETDSGGWTVFQRRKDGTVNFLREWQDYKHGFGNIAGEYWLGNENLYLMTNQDLYELRIDLKDFDGGDGFTTYSSFAVGSEKEKYSLKLLGPITGGDAGDGLTYHASVAFSTIDVDHDHWEGGHCAKDHSGGWWYNQCDASNLNGRYLNGVNSHEYEGVYWHEWHGPSYSLMVTTMMIRPVRRKALAVPKPSLVPTPEPEVALNFDF